MVQWRKCESRGWWSHRSSHFCAACGKPLTQNTTSRGASKGKGKGKSKGTGAPAAQQVEKQVKKTLTKLGALPSQIEPSKSYADAVKGPKSSDIDMIDADSGKESAPAYLETWQDMSPSQLKSEGQRLEQLAKQMRELKLSKAESEILLQLEDLKEFQRSKMSGGQRLDTMQTAVRKAVASQEKAREQIADLKQEMEEQQAKLENAKLEEVAAQEALDKAKKDMLHENTPKASAEGMELTAASAAFVTALMPPDLPAAMSTQLQMFINALVAAVQGEVQKTIQSVVPAATEVEKESQSVLTLPGIPAPTAMQTAQATQAAELSKANAASGTAATQIDETSQDNGFGKTPLEALNVHSPTSTPRKRGINDERKAICLRPIRYSLSGMTGQDESFWWLLSAPIFSQPFKVFLDLNEPLIFNWQRRPLLLTGSPKCRAFEKINSRHR